jgi:hypothetical protein
LFSGVPFVSPLQGSYHLLRMPGVRFTHPWLLSDRPFGAEMGVSRQKLNNSR